MKHVFLFFLLLLSITGFSQSDNPALNPQNSHIQILRDGKRWFLEAGANGAAVISQNGEFTTSVLGGDGGDSLRIEQVDSLFIVILYSGDTEIARDSAVIEGGGAGASTLAEVSTGSDDATKSLYTMTATVPAEFESSDNNTILYLDETNERIGLKTASPGAALHLGSGAMRITDLTASQIVATDANKDLQTLTTATYPSLTELSYVKGVTSSIQTQLAARPTGSGSTGFLPIWSSSTALTSSTLHENTSNYVTNITRGMAIGDNVSSTAAGFGYRIHRGSLSGGFSSDGSRIYFLTTTNHPLWFMTNSIAFAAFQANQGVTFGTTTPSTHLLHLEDITFAGSGSLSGAILNMQQTWNSSGNTTAVKLNVTNTASGALSKLMDLQIGAVSQFHITKAGTLHNLGSAGIGIVTPISKLHVYQDNANTDSTVGLTIEQDGTGDALTHYLLTAGRRWTLGIDNSDADKYKIATDGLDYFEIDANAETMDLSIHGSEKVSVSATKTEITNAIRYTGILDVTAWAAQQDNYAPAGGDSASVFLVDLTGNQTITGMSLPNYEGLWATLINTDATDTITIAHANGGSSAINQFALESGGNLTVPPGGRAECLYIFDGVNSRWRCWKLWFFLIPFRFRKRKKV